jgi:hypothetical protein
MAAHPYATYANFTAVYSVSGLSQTALENHYLPAGARWLDSKLAKAFTVPFSSNNVTARDMNIYSAMLLFLQGRTSKQDDAAELRAFLDAWISDLTSGNGSMSLADDTVLVPTGAQYQAWSTTRVYQPTLANMLDAEDQEVDPDRTDAEKDAQRP